MENRKLKLYCSRCGEKIYEYCWIREGSLDYHQVCYAAKKKEEEERKWTAQDVKKKLMETKVFTGAITVME